jgi:RNA polymerase sigma-70 factor (ECF subfamily)
MRDRAACGMDEEEFRAFHGKTARPLRAYLVRLSRDRALADDVLQEAYLRLLAARLPPEADADRRRNYLYRIATNLLRDHFRREKAHGDEARSDALDDVPGRDRTAEEFETRRDVTRALDRLKPKERQLLWLAYVERFSHKEIAAIVGFKPDSVRPLLFRARQKLADLLRRHGLRPPSER